MLETLKVAALSVLLALSLTMVLALGATARAAGSAPTAAADPALEKRVMAVAVELRCLVCQNQTIADSDAALAVDLRNQVRTMLREGKDEREVLDYMTARYGEFVLYRPPVKNSTLLLWFGPPLLLGGALLTLWLVLRGRSRMPASEFEADDDDDDEWAAADAPPRQEPR